MNVTGLELIIVSNFFPQKYDPFWYGKTISSTKKLMLQLAMIDRYIILYIPLSILCIFFVLV
jgi:hypothetical protein